MKALMSKWIIQALLPNHSNMQVLLRYCINQLQPSSHDRRGSYSLWLFSPTFSIKCKSKIWRHIAQAWTVMAHTTTFLSPSCSKDILQLSFWWRMEYDQSKFGITMNRSFVLYKKGMRHFQGIWDPARHGLLEWEIARKDSPSQRSTMTSSSSCLKTLWEFQKEVSQQT